MAKTKITPKNKKNSDDLLLIAGIMLLLVGSYMFFITQNGWQPPAQPTATPFATATPTVSILQGPASDGIVFINMTTDNAYSGLKNGSVDISFSPLTAAQALEAKNNPNITLYSATSQINGMIFNPAPTANGTFNPFALQQVRFAFNYLLDRQALVTTAHAGFGKAILTNVYAGHPSYYTTAGAIEDSNIS